MYFVNYFYVTVTDAAPKCPNRLRRVGPAPNCPDAELAVPSWHCRICGADLSHFGKNQPRWRLGRELRWAEGNTY